MAPTTPVSSISAVQLDDGVTINSTKQNLADIVMGYTPSSGISPVNFSYQDFGPWAYTTSTGGSINWFSYGIPFSGTMLTSGSATYLGIAKGNFINPSGVLYNTTANMTATAQFTNAGGTVAFSTTSTNMLPSNPAYGTTTTANANLDLNGTLTITGNNFTGTVQNSANTISGNASGLFYGQPVTGGTSTIGSPREIGGTYAATGTDGTVIGAFGGKAQ